MEWCAEKPLHPRREDQASYDADHDRGKRSEKAPPELLQVIPETECSYLSHKKLALMTSN
jgi:hypothetical protein